MTRVMKRQRLTGMKYDRVDFVPDGANGQAHILITKNRANNPQVFTKAMGTVTCNNCGTKMGRSHKMCPKCGSYNLSKIRVDVTKTVTPLVFKKKSKPMKQEPKNDDSGSTAGQNNGDTFEDEQLNKDDDANGQYIDEGDENDNATSVEKIWYDIPLSKAKMGGKGDDVETVDNTENEHEAEGEDNDEDIESLAEMNPEKKTGRKGYKSTTSTSSDSTTGVMNKSKKPYKNVSWDHGDEGSQVVVENVEQMYRSESEPDTSQDDSSDSTLSKVVNKAFPIPGPTQLSAVKRGKKRKVGVGRNKGLDVLERGSKGIYNSPGVSTNGTNTGHGAGNNKLTQRDRSAVAPPNNPNDVGKKRVVLRKRRSASPSIEALNLAVAFAENMDVVLKSKNPEKYSEVMEDFVGTMNAAAGVWFNDATVAKGFTAPVQRERIAKAVNRILKASLDAELSDEASEGVDPADVDKKMKSKVSHSPTNTDAGDVTGMVNKSGTDIYKGLTPQAAAILQEAESVIEKGKVAQWEQEAARYSNIPGVNVEQLAKSLRLLSETDEAAYEELRKSLASASANLADNVIFKQLGVAGANTPTDPMAAARAFADERIAKGSDAPSRDVLMAQYMQEHAADFYQSSVKMPS